VRFKTVNSLKNWRYALCIDQVTLCWRIMATSARCLAE